MKFRPSVLLFWDYDGQWGYDRSRNTFTPSWRPHDEFENTERLLELHAEYEIPSCFAVVGAAALPGKRPYHDPAQIRRICESGHEVASHSMHHEWLPALDSKALRRTLKESKDALEQCIGAPVVTFVPPFNQPFDYPKGLSFSFSERRICNGHRNDVSKLCEALRETGYSFCRVSYRPLPQRIAEWLSARRLDSPVCPVTIAGIQCLRLNTPGGFASDAVAMIDRVAQDGGIAVLYGHPHSLQSGNNQDEKYLVSILRRIRQLQKGNRLRVILPRELVATFERAA